jgi:hypothetical protein
VLLAALIVKALVKHGWPSRYVLSPYPDTFRIEHYHTGRDAAPEYWQAVEIACRIVARAYRVEIDANEGVVILHGSYEVTSRGSIRKV